MPGKHCSQCFIHVTSFNPFNNSGGRHRDYPCFPDASEGTEKLSHLLKVTQLVLSAKGGL